MTPTLVFLHGRGQEFRDPTVLRGDWLTALDAGLVAAGHAPLHDPAVAFPFYADELYRVTADLTRSGAHVQLESLPAPGVPGPLHPDLPADAGLVERQLIAQLAFQAGMIRPEGLDALLAWGPARTALRWLADHTRVDQQIIGAFLKDVAVYLTRARDGVLEIVRAAVPATGDLVVVSHSLGTVVARDLLDDPDIRSRTRLWVTAGSPLALEAVQRNLRTPGRTNPGVPWLTAYDVNDVVALGHPFRPIWGEPLTDVRVENADQPHSIARYLAHPEVADPIGRAVSRSLVDH